MKETVRQIEQDHNMSNIDSEQYCEDLLKLSEFYLNDNDISSSEALLNKIISINPDHAEAQNNLGVAYFHTNNLEKAQIHIEKAVNLNNRNKTYLENLIDVLKIIEDIPKATKYISEYLNDKGPDDEIIKLYADITGTGWNGGDNLNKRETDSSPKDISSLQDQLDNIPYPQNYYYDIKTLEAKGQLLERFEYWEKYVPELLAPCNKFLSIGCSLGYLMLYHSKTSTICKGIEPDKITFNLLSDIITAKRLTNVKVHNNTFTEMNKNERFDLIWMGNVFHYMYVDYGWDVARQLADISNGLCIIEAPLEGKFLYDQKDTYPYWDNKIFMLQLSKQKFFERMGVYFEIGEIFPAGTDPLNRSLIVLKRKKETDVSIEQIKEKELIKEFQYTQIFKTKINEKNYIYKRRKKTDLFNFEIAFKGYQILSELNCKSLVKVYDYRINNEEHLEVLMEDLSDYDNVHELKLNMSEKFEVVKKTFAILNEIFDKGFLITDADYENIMISNKEIKIIDLDSITDTEDITKGMIDWIFSRLKRFEEWCPPAGEIINHFKNKLVLVQKNYKF